MGVEIERIFLVKNDSWQSLTQGVLYRQGYLSTDKHRTVRIRTVGTKGFLTIKGVPVNRMRSEYEYEIPLIEAERMLETLCLRPLIEKKRYKIEYKNMIWEVDEFEGDNLGLIIAEIELEDADQDFAKPDWIGDEVTDNPAYYNANLIRKPYNIWDKNC